MTKIPTKTKETPTKKKRILRYGCSPVLIAPAGLVVVGIVAAIVGERDMALCCLTFALCVLALTLVLAYLDKRHREEQESIREFFREIKRQNS